MLGRPVPELGGGRDGLVHERPAGDVYHVEQPSAAAAAAVPALQQRSLDDVQSQGRVLLMRTTRREWLIPSFLKTCHIFAV